MLASPGLITLFVLAFGVACLLAGPVVWSRAPGETANRLFAALTSSLGLLALFVMLVLTQGADSEAAELWWRLSRFWPISLALFAHLSICLTQPHQDTPQRRALLYSSAVVVMVTDMSTPWISGVRWGGEAWVLALGTAPAVSAATAVWIAVVAMIGLMSALSALRHIEPRIRWQARALVTATTLPVLQVAITRLFGDRVPMTGWLWLPYAVLTLWLAVTAWAVTRHGAYTADPLTVADNAFDAMGDILLVLDGIGRIRRASPATQLLGYDPQSVIDQPIDILLFDPSNDDTFTEHGLLGEVASQRLRGHLMDFRTKGGERVPMAANVNVIPGLGLVIVARDMRKTQQLLMEAGAARAAQERADELEQLNKQLKRAHDHLVESEKLAALGRLAGSMAHEINNPLTAMLMAATYLDDDLAAAHLQPEQGPWRDMSGRSLSAARRCKEVVDNMLAFARRKPVQRRPIDLSDVIQDTVRLVDRSLRSQKVSVHVDDQHPPPVLGDQAQLGQVLLNLLLNGADAMPNGGRIEVTATAHPDGAALVVQDQGTGMDDDILAQIFEPFFTTKTEPHGTGLGLSVSYGIIQDHNGHIDVQSTVDKGSRFTVVLPTAP